MKKLTKLVENIAVYTAERSVGKIAPLCVHKVEKPDRLEELLKRCKENKDRD